MHKIYWVIIVLSAVLGNVSAQIVPRFETAACALQIPTGEKVECGYLVVPEDRQRKNDKTIRLPIIILKSDSPAPKPDPVLRTLGGPGGSSLRMVSGRRFSPWLKDRDQIIFEQRGTKYAQPALECPEVSAAKIGAVKERLTEKESKKRELAAVKICRDRLVKEGVNLAAYNSAESAADIEDLRRALKLEKINLLGVSYSARLMLNLMRDHPDGIRSVVLESTLPPEVNYDEVGVDGVVRALDLFFGKCAADAECNKTFPQLETKFYELVKKTNSNPLLIGVKDAKTGETVNVRLSGHDLVTWLVDYTLSADGNAITAAPLNIQAVIDGNYSSLKDYAESKLQPDFYSLGMRYSVWCREEMPFQNRKKVSAQSSRYSKISGYEVQTLPDVCRIWKLPVAARIENQPVKSAIPTLVVAGEFDAYTPPEWGKTTAANLANGFFVTVPWVGHGPSFSSPLCVSEMIAEFFNNPAAAPNQACLGKIENYFKFKTKKS
jgi:pimeloyl-ACP methyl ester carboxylesterase